VLLPPHHAPTPRPYLIFFLSLSQRFFIFHSFFISELSTLIAASASLSLSETPNCLFNLLPMAASEAKEAPVPPKEVVEEHLEPLNCKVFKTWFL
jgi:hypothetical protein